MVATVLLWVGVAFGVLNIAAHGYFTWQATGDLSGASPLLVTTALFIFVQGRLILGLKGRNPKLRDRLALITGIRVLLLGANAAQVAAVAPVLLLPPIAGLVLQVIGLSLLYVPPGRWVFAKPAQ